MSDDILVRTAGRVTEIVLNRPDAGNGVTNEMAAALGNAIAGAGESHFIVLRGAGEDFCTGRAVMGARPAGRPSAYERRAQNEVIFECYGAFRRSPIPVVGVVQGRALGFVETPPRLLVYEIGSDHVLGRWFGDPGVMQVQVRPLRR